MTPELPGLAAEAFSVTSPTAQIGARRRRSRLSLGLKALYGAAHLGTTVDSLEPVSGELLEQRFESVYLGPLGNERLHGRLQEAGFDRVEADHHLAEGTPRIEIGVRPAGSSPRAHARGAAHQAHRPPGARARRLRRPLNHIEALAAPFPHAVGDRADPTRRPV